MDQQEQGNRLFVGNLPFSMTQDGLREWVAKVDGVEVTDAVVVMDREGRFGPRSKGYGFVTVADADQAQKVIAALNGNEVEGRKVAIDVARPRRQEGSAPMANGS